MSKRYYWLKLHTNFFDRQEIKLLESQENGATYILLYLKLLTKSIESEGALRYNAMIPYDEKMLSVITNTNIDIVRAAMIAFSNLGLLEIMSDKTIYMNEINNLIGTETTEAQRKREYRAKVKNIDNGTMSRQCPREIDIDIDIDKEKDNSLTPKPPLIGGVNENEFSFPTSNALFNTFWNEYPKQVNLLSAFNTFELLNVDKNLLEIMLNSLDEQKTSEQWQRMNGRFIPQAEKWLSEKRWNDKLPNTIKKIEIDPVIDKALDDFYKRI